MRHLLVDQHGAVTGVIDWDEMSLSDPALDLTVAYTAFAGPARAVLLAVYGPVPSDRRLRARALAVRMSALLAAYASAQSRPALLREALRGLHRAVAP